MTRTSGNAGRPRVLLLLHLPPPVNGVTAMGEIVVSSSVVREGCDPLVVRIGGASSIRDIGRIRPGKALDVLSTAARLAAACLTHRPRLAYFTLTPNGTAFYRDLLFVAILKSFGVRRLYHIHGKGIERIDGSKLADAFCRFAFGGATVILLSPSLYERSARYVPRECAFFLPNGVPDPTGGAGPAPRPPGDRPIPTILFFSNLAVSKGIFILLDALRRIAERGIPFRAVFAGAWESERVEARFRSCVEEAGLTLRIDLPGACFGEAKIAVFASADIMAFPSINDAFPLVLLEAMGHGLPVVSTFEGAIADIVEHGLTGFLVPKGDAGAVADHLAELLTDPERCARMGAAGRKRYLEKFTIQSFEANLGMVLRSVFP